MISNVMVAAFYLYIFGIGIAGIIYSCNTNKPKQEPTQVKQLKANERYEWSKNGK